MKTIKIFLASSNRQLFLVNSGVLLRHPSGSNTELLKTDDSRAKAGLTLISSTVALLVKSVGIIIVRSIEKKLTFTTLKSTL